MIPLATLKKAVAEGLAYVQAQPDVKEAEVFASANGVLLARMNYTSHIPSNGVEEPKSFNSFGLGIRVVFKDTTGVKTGFGSEPSSLTLEGVKQALAKARKGAVQDPEFVSLPTSTGEKRTLTRYHDPAVMHIKDADLPAAGWRVVRGALEVFKSSEELLELAGNPNALPSLGFILGGDVTLIQERIAIASTHLPKVQADETTLAFSFTTSMIETQDAKGTSSDAVTHLADLSDQSGREAARNAISAMAGQRVKSGKYKVVLGRQPVTDLLHNIILSSLGAGTFYAGASPYQGKLGKQVASEQLTMYDDGSIPGLAGSKGITCEGLPTGRTDLIRNGTLVGLLCNFYESQRMLHDPKAREKLGADPKEWQKALAPRNGFRFARGGGRHFDAPPGVAATNVIIEGSRGYSHDELLRMVGDGLYIGRIWYTYPINGLAAGDFTCTVVGDSYIIKDGKLAGALKPNTVRLNDSIHNIFGNVLGIGQQRRPTIVWAADQIVHAPEIAVGGVQVDEIAGFMERV